MTTPAERQRKLNDLIDKGTRSNALLSNEAFRRIERDIKQTRIVLADLLADYAKKDNTISKARINSLLRELDDVERQIRRRTERGMRTAIKDAASAESRMIYRSFTDVYGDVPRLDVNFGRLNDSIVDYVANRFGEDDLVLSERVWIYAADKRSEMARIIRTGIMRSESINALTQSVRRAYPNDYWKVRRLVQTEMRTAQRASHSLYAQRSGIPVNLRLIRGRADRPEHACTPLSIANDFGLGRGVYPPDQFPSNPHPNCTSTVEYVVDEKNLFIGLD